MVQLKETIRPLVGLVVVTVLFACGSSDTVVDPKSLSAELAASGTVDAAGGTIQHADIALTIPAAPLA
jgi:hypothetical protein